MLLFAGRIASAPPHRRRPHSSCSETGSWPQRAQFHPQKSQAAPMQRTPGRTGSKARVEAEAKAAANRARCHANADFGLGTHQLDLTAAQPYQKEHGARSLNDGIS